jgi:hypothetical protein
MHVYSRIYATAPDEVKPWAKKWWKRLCLGFDWRQGKGDTLIKTIEAPKKFYAGLKPKPLNTYEDAFRIITRTECLRSIANFIISPLPLNRPEDIAGVFITETDRQELYKIMRDIKRGRINRPPPLSIQDYKKVFDRL